MKPDIARPLLSLPAETRIVFETRYMAAVAHGVHMLSQCLPGNGPVLRISRLVAEITHCAPEVSYTPGDFAKLAERTPPDPEAGVRLEAVVDLIWRAAAFQDEPVRAALVDLVSGFTKPRQSVV